MKSAEERYQIAKELDSIVHSCALASDEQVEAIFDAIDIISPKYASDRDAEIKATLNDPAFQKEVEAICGTITPEEEKDFLSIRENRTE